jgi:hypothetical protein
MKKLTLIMLALLLLGVANAQSNKEEVDYIQSIFGMNKKAMVADFIKVDASKQVAFWKVYDEYETARKNLGKQRIALLSQYAEIYKNMSNEIAEKWLNDAISISKETDNLLFSYTKKVKNVTDPVTALKFYHIESYILSSIKTAILEEIPFVHSK